MFEKINKAIINGKCFTEDTEILLYEKPENRISIIYGKNGSGKSTLGEAINFIHSPNDNINKVSLVDFEGNEISLDEILKNNIFVFNEDFINRNISISDDGLSTIIMLGEQNDVEKEIADHKEKLNKVKANYDRVKKEDDKLSDENEISSPLNIKEKFLKTLKSEQGWAKRDSEIKGNANKSKVIFDVMVNKLSPLKVSDSEADLRKSFCETLELYKKSGNIETEYRDKIEPVVIPGDIDHSIIELLSEEVKKIEFSELEQKIHETILEGKQRIVERTNEVFAVEKKNICPCCYQSVSDEYREYLITCINHVLNEDIKNFEERLQRTKLEEISFNTELYKTLDNEIITDIILAIQECNKTICKYNEYINQRLENIYTPISIAQLDLSAKIKDLNLQLKRLETNRLEFNKAIRERKKIKEKLDSINLKLALIETETFLGEYFDAKDKQNKLSNELKQLKDEKSSIEKEIEKLKDKKKNINISLDLINKLLSYVFLDSKRIKLETKNDKFILKSQGANVKPKDVSIGERNIIALCYFFVNSLKGREKQNCYTQESLYVIDDPVSSFDIDNRVGIQSLLRYQTEQIIKGNNNSRILFMSHDLNAIYDYQKSVDDIADKTKKCLCIMRLLNKQATKYEFSKEQEYACLLESIYSFASSEEISGNNYYSIGNDMRRVLEAFSTFEYRVNASELSTKPLPIKALEEKDYAYKLFFQNLMYRLVLNRKSHTQETVMGASNYRFFDEISDEEKIKTAKGVLCLIYLLNKNHLISQLKDDTKIQKIEEWCEEIKGIFKGTEV
jgi:VE01